MWPFSPDYVKFTLPLNWWMKPTECSICFVGSDIFQTRLINIQKGRFEDEVEGIHTDRQTAHLPLSMSESVSESLIVSTIA